MIQPTLERLGIDSLKPMQEAALEAIQPGKDLILLSPTGSGKTLAFLLPLLKMVEKDSAGVRALILTPSRELALQIEQVFKQMQTGLKVNACYGGHPMRTERNNMKEPAALLVGTPGRIADHLRRDSFDPTTIQYLVLDEFDKSLEFGFKNEMEFIIRQLTGLKSRVLTSATPLDEIPAFTGVSDPVIIDFTSDEPEQRLNLCAVRAEGTDKAATLFQLLCHLGSASSLIFCNHRETVERISELLTENGIVHGTYHGGLEQEEREIALIKFRNGTHHLLLTSDLASRGLDIPEIRNVIHYQLPTTVTAWLHRNGRTARMHAHGTAWLVLAADDYVPKFITEEVKFVELSDKEKIPDLPVWETLYIGAGKKDKISKGDIVGFLLQKGKLGMKDLGKIEVLDYASFAAVNRAYSKQLLLNIANEQIKKKTVKIDIAR